MSPTAVVVGSSIGGVRTAQALRAAGYDGEVVLVGEERALPYDKPPLSKALLSGRATVDDVTLLTDRAASDAGIRLVLGRRAARLDVARRHVELADGERLPYDDLVVATGARARPSPWGRPPGLHVLRTLDDAAALAHDLRRGGPLVIVGGGFIGAEVAATARGMGIEDVTVVDPVPAPLGRLLDPAVAELFTRLHRERGVTTRFGVGVTAVESTGDSLAVRLDDGSTLPAATVLVGIGAEPNDRWLRSSGLRIDDGVLCDRFGRALDAPGVHALGDVARWSHPARGRPVRGEHWTNAVEQAACVAHNITHPDAPRAHEPVAYVWSDQFDWRIQLTGSTGGGLDHVSVPGRDPLRSFAVLYADQDGRFRGALTVNWPRALLVCRRSVAGAGAVQDVRRAVEATARRTETTA